MQATPPVTRLCTHSLDRLWYRDADLVDELLGKRTFGEVMFYQILGRMPSAAEMRIVDAVLIVLMEHGLTPSAIATRLIYMSAPENLQGGVAAGLLAVGSQFVGTMENCAKNLEALMSAPEGVAAAARTMARDYRSRKAALPGFGHHLHKPDDPRAAKLLDLVAAEEGIGGDHVRALREFSAAVDEVYGRHITINATGAVAASLGEIGVPWQIMRGFAVISRSAGLVAHIAEEQKEPSGRFIWDCIDHAIPYVGAGQGHNREGGAS